MIEKKEIKQIISKEKELYLGENPAKRADMKKRHHKRYVIWRYLYYFRCWQLNLNERSNKSLSAVSRRWAKTKQHYYEKKKNIWSPRAGVEIGGQCNIGSNCDIWHSGVVINGDIGENCVFHGNNIIGNKGIGKSEERPTLGNNVDVGANAVIIGDVYIADGCVIGAGAVVTKSFYDEGSIIVGVPGKKIN